MTTPLPHVRRSGLPWRDADRTECGQPLWTIAAEHLLDRAQALNVVRDQGIETARQTLCWPCVDSTVRTPEWDADPVRALLRELTGSGGPPQDLAADLRALAALVDRHGDEFEALREGMGGVVSLDARRARATRQAAVR